MTENPWTDAGWQWVPPKYDETRDRPGDDRDSREPAILAGLMTDMDALIIEWQRHCRSKDVDLVRSIGADMADKWAAIKEAMKP